MFDVIHQILQSSLVLNLPVALHPRLMRRALDYESPRSNDFAHHVFEDASEGYEVKRRQPAASVDQVSNLGPVKA